MIWVSMQLHIGNFLCYYDDLQDVKAIQVMCFTYIQGYWSVLLISWFWVFDRLAYNWNYSGDVSAYIPTNVISITDGQIFLETEYLLVVLDLR
jgi:hypothetical protein